MAFDSAHGMVYGIINQTTGLSSQFYALDIYTQQLTVQTLPANILPQQLIYSPGINMVLILDNRNAASGAYVPTLYKIW